LWSNGSDKKGFWRTDTVTWGIIILQHIFKVFLNKSQWRQNFAFVCLIVEAHRLYSFWLFCSFAANNLFIKLVVSGNKTKHITVAIMCNRFKIISYLNLTIPQMTIELGTNIAERFWSASTTVWNITTSIYTLSPVFNCAICWY
jgi:hypothetical protein